MQTALQIPDTPGDIENLRDTEDLREIKRSEVLFLLREWFFCLCISGF